MADEWRVRECFNQVALFFAFEARNMLTAGTRTAIQFPAPLRPYHNVGRDPKHPARARDVGADPRRLDDILRKAVSPAKAAVIAQEPRWKVGHLVTWWIEAGVAVAAWRTARRDGGEPSAALLEAAVGRLRLEDYGVYPPCWCADHADTWRLARECDARQPPSWSAAGTGPGDYVAALIEWCGHPGREQGPEEPASPDDWAVGYRNRYLKLDAACGQLLRTPCQAGKSGELAESGADWEAFHAAASPSRIRVLRPPVRTAAEGRAVARGWFMPPRPATLVADLRQAPGMDAPAGSIPRAVARALGRWEPEDTTFGPVLPRNDGEDGDAADLRDAADRLVAVASLVLAVEFTTPARRDPPPTDPADLPIRDRIRMVLALEGIAARWLAAAGDGRHRVVPLDAAADDPPAGGGPLLVVAAPGGPAVVVGEVGPAARCGDGLLSAIEALDWRWWATRTLRDAGHRDAEVDAVVATADDLAWESLKRDLLGLEPAGAATHGRLAAAHAAVHAARHRLVSPERRPAARGIVTRTMAAMADVEVAICGTLAAADPERLARLDPPRTADGGVAVAVWLRDAGSHGHARSAVLAWEAAPEAFATPLREMVDADGRVTVVVSAGAGIPEADLRLLAGPGLTGAEDLPGDEAVIAPLRSAVQAAVAAATVPDFAAAIAGIRAGLADERSEAFDRFVRRAVVGEPRAVAWIRLLHDDERFAFTCHPPLDIDASGVRVRPAAVGDPLAWRDADVESGADVEIRFATGAARSRRIASRGRHGPDSAEACAARLEAMVDAGDAELAAAAAAVREAVDRRRHFGDGAADPVAAAVAAANVVARRAAAAADPAADRAAAACREIAACCAALGATLVPRDWHPARGAAAAGLDVDRIGFHASVPVGDLVVLGFGATAADGGTIARLEAFVSAGPAQAEFAEVEERARALAGDEEPVARFRRCVTEFPMRVVAGQGPTAAAGLFDAAWKAVLAFPGREDLRQAAMAVHAFLDRGYDMVVFEPKAVGEYQETWLRTPAGTVARGLRVDRLLRPGLRTLDNKLVWPAIVEAR